MARGRWLDATTAAPASVYLVTTRPHKETIMNVLDLSLPRQHQVPRIPLWVKLAYTLFVGILVPFYLRGMVRRTSCTIAMWPC